MNADNRTENNNLVSSRRRHFINSDYGFGADYTVGNTFNNNFKSRNRRGKKLGKILSLIYFPLLLLWLESLVKLSSGLSVFSGLLFTNLFSVPVGLLLMCLSTAAKNSRINRITAYSFNGILSVWYCAQLVYNNVFGTFFVINSITRGGTTQALNSVDMIMTALASRWLFILLGFLPLALSIVFGKRLNLFEKTTLPLKGIVLGVAVAVQLLAILLVNSDKASSDSKSAYILYHGELQQNAACEKFGLFTMQRLDLSRMLFGYKAELRHENAEPAATPPKATLDTPVKPQTIDVDLEKAEKNADSEDLKQVCSYISSAQPSYTNEYTAMFKDFNVVFITAESFSQYCIDKELTPTLYKMYNEGFQFEDFYTPAWGVSTTDGEYANLLGIIPKSGVWSFSQSADDSVGFSFSLAQQARAKKYDEVRAYHNHTYDYYDRDKYLTNLGYDYSAIGKGLDLGENVWPNSDLKMMQKTVGDYVNADSFSVYYMSVSGHGGYSYNTISARNSELVKNLSYSDEVKGYLAANIELDRAVEYLVGELERAGKLDKTLICIAADHYPYSLDEFKGLDELAGHKVDTVFERYKNAWLMWSPAMKEPVKCDKYCSSLDILPTMLNLLGYEYDSRAIIGTDVFGGRDPFVVFSDRSWISQNGSYNASSGKYTAFKSAKGKDDVDALHNKCTNMFTVSRMILDTNAYEKIYGGTHIKGK